MCFSVFSFRNTFCVPMGKTLWKSQNVSLNGFFWGKHHPAPAVYRGDGALLDKTVMTLTNSGFTAMIGYSQYLIMPKHLSKELAEPMNINWKTSSQVSTGLRMDKCQSSNIV